MFVNASDNGKIEILPIIPLEGEAFLHSRISDG
ncbi:MAG: hypothetical protein CMIDDMOC_00635 [Sodalis sp. Fle]|nr:MAG: hypothetical protein CMIDDMOC_00635 [Sodalis sp. Fle]